MEKQKPTTILIAGGGIVGLTLAMSIKKQLGIVPEIYEKTKTFATEAGAGLGMYPNGLRVLRDISPEFLQAVREAGYPYTRRHWERHDGSEIMKAEESIMSGGASELDSIGIRRSSLQKVLYNYATFQGIKVHFRKRLKDAVQREDGLVEVTFEDGTTRLTQVLFGADGALGKSRGIVAGEDAPAIKYCGVTCLMGLSRGSMEGIHFPSSDKDDFHAVFFPTAENETCFQFHVPIPEEASDSKNWGNLSKEVGQEECRKIAAVLRENGWHPKYIEPLENLVQAVRVGFALLEPRLNKWVNGRVALVGDAAHPPVPYIGQGAQQGLEDAGVAVSLLKIYCMKDGKFDPTNFEKAMTLYQEIRMKRSSQILDFSKSLGEMQNRRSAGTDDALMEDHALQGDVLMYGTLPIMMPGANHDYKDDVKRATEELNLPEVDTKKALEAVEYLLGLEEDSLLPTDKPTVEVKKPKANTTKLKDAYKLKSERVEELIEWLATGLEQHLKRIVAHNEALSKVPEPDESKVAEAWEANGAAIVDEVSEIVEVPENERERILAEHDPHWIVLPKKVREQLHEYIRAIAHMYHDNPFHNFEHACNVTVSVSKFLTRMSKEKGATLTLNDRTYGIAGDPLTQFSIVLAALLHDADHRGIPNTQLLKEHPELAGRYHNKAIAEQHSVHVAFEVLMESKYKDLRLAIYNDEAEMRRFRQLIVNVVLATDICDKDLRDFRNKRWEKAFSEETKEYDPVCEKNLKATIGIETLIQASDISHTMQPWHVYRQWNERLFAELYKAYAEGRAEKDPAEFWFNGEIGFFDFYIIPLAKKLEKCDIFGSMSQECLNFAERNKEAWLEKGDAAIREMIEKVHVCCE